MASLPNAAISELQNIFFIELVYSFISVGDLGIFLDLKLSPCYQVLSARSWDLDKKESSTCQTSERRVALEFVYQQSEYRNNVFFNSGVRSFEHHVFYLI